MKKEISFKVECNPMSMNNVYPTGKNGYRYLTAEGKAYKDVIAWEAKDAMSGATPFAGKVWVQMDIYFPDNRKDTNNCIKLVLDAMEGIVYENDRQIWQESYFRHVKEGWNGLIIHIGEYAKT